jgi:hypothetical protein
MSYVLVPKNDIIDLELDRSRDASAHCVLGFILMKARKPATGAGNRLDIR